MPIIKALALHCVCEWQFICLKKANKLGVGGLGQRFGEVVMNSGVAVLLSAAIIKSNHQEGVRYHVTSPQKEQPL